MDKMEATHRGQPPSPPPPPTPPLGRRYDVGDYQATFQFQSTPPWRNPSANFTADISATSPPRSSPRTLSFEACASYRKKVDAQKAQDFHHYQPQQEQSHARMSYKRPYSPTIPLPSTRGQLYGGEDDDEYGNVHVAKRFRGLGQDEGGDGNHSHFHRELDRMVDEERNNYNRSPMRQKIYPSSSPNTFLPPKPPPILTSPSIQAPQPWRQFQPPALPGLLNPGYWPDRTPGSPVLATYGTPLYPTTYAPSHVRSSIYPPESIIPRSYPPGPYPPGPYPPGPCPPGPRTHQLGGFDHIAPPAPEGYSNYPPETQTPLRPPSPFLPGDRFSGTLNPTANPTPFEQGNGYISDKSYDEDEPDKWDEEETDVDDSIRHNIPRVVAPSGAHVAVNLSSDDEHNDEVDGEYDDEVAYEDDEDDEDDEEDVDDDDEELGNDEGSPTVPHMMGDVSNDSDGDASMVSNVSSGEENKASEDNAPTTIATGIAPATAPDLLEQGLPGSGQAVGGVHAATSVPSATSAGSANTEFPPLYYAATTADWTGHLEEMSDLYRQKNFEVSDFELKSMAHSRSSDISDILWRDFYHRQRARIVREIASDFMTVAGFNNQGAIAAYMKAMKDSGDENIAVAAAALFDQFKEAAVARNIPTFMNPIGNPFGGHGNDDVDSDDDMDSDYEDSGSDEDEDKDIDLQISDGPSPLYSDASSVTLDGNLLSEVEWVYSESESKSTSTPLNITRAHSQYFEDEDDEDEGGQLGPAMKPPVTLDGDLLNELESVYSESESTSTPLDITHAHSLHSEDEGGQLGSVMKPLGPAAGSVGVSSTPATKKEEGTAMKINHNQPASPLVLVISDSEDEPQSPRLPPRLPPRCIEISDSEDTPRPSSLPQSATFSPQRIEISDSEDRPRTASFPHLIVLSDSESDGESVASEGIYVHTTTAMGEPWVPDAHDEQSLREDHRGADEDMSSGGEDDDDVSRSRRSATHGSSSDDEEPGNVGEHPPHGRPQRTLSYFERFLETSPSRRDLRFNPYARPLGPRATGTVLQSIPMRRGIPEEQSDEEESFVHGFGGDSEDYEVENYALGGDSENEEDDIYERDTANVNERELFEHEGFAGFDEENSQVDDESDYLDGSDSLFGDEATWQHGGGAHGPDPWDYEADHLDDMQVDRGYAGGDGECEENSDGAEFDEYAGLYGREGSGEEYSPEREVMDDQDREYRRRREAEEFDQFLRDGERW